jgi:2-amino-4-hydroxy-6-hydroxymethyldihydropteridine diphosphokinase
MIEAVADPPAFNLASPKLALLGLGSNIGDRASNLRLAIDRLANARGCQVDKVSQCYETEPVGPADQAWFLNIVVKCQVHLNAFELLAIVKGIENDMGRIAGARWGPRVIDIDLLLVGDARIATPDLVIPHPELWNRAFVLVPLLDVLSPGLLETQIRARLKDLADGPVVRPWKSEIGAGL